MDRKRDNDRAIADLNEAIRLGPSYPPGVFNNRGIAWGHKGDNDRAIADYDEAIRLDPRYAAAFNDRGIAWCRNGDNDRAIADYDEAIRLDPKSAKAAYENRGICRFLNGLFDAAAYDLNEAIRLDTKNSRLHIWRYLARARGGAVSLGKSELGASQSSVDAGKWPAPIIDLLLGQLDPSTLLTVARSEGSETGRVQACEAHFFLGEFYGLAGQPVTARENLVIATQDCPKKEDEYFAAVSELKRMPP
jgi:lipoprotein NlpI